MGVFGGEFGNGMILDFGFGYFNLDGWIVRVSIYCHQGQGMIELSKASKN